MGGRGASGGGREGGGGGLDPGNIVSISSLISERETKQELVDQTLKVLREMNDNYGSTVNEVELAVIKGKDGASVMGYCDGENIGINNRFFSDKMETAYDDCVKAGFHPGRGDKSAIEAVVAHEFGHKLSADVGKILGRGGTTVTHAGADYIVNEALKAVRGTNGVRGVVQLARKISRYATSSNAEAVAEAVADVYCNGSRAKRESKAIVDVINKVLKK